MNENEKISYVNYKKYTTILNEIIEALSRLHQSLTESFHDGHRMEAKFKTAIVSLKCIDRKYRNLIFNGDPPCAQCTTKYLQSKKNEREEVRQKLQEMRKEYYMQEEHLSKISHAFQETEKKLAIQSINCTRDGLLISRLLWTATKPRMILERLTSECAAQLHEFLNLVEGCIYAFTATYKDSMPDSCCDEYQYVTSLCGILTNLSSIPEGRLFLLWNPFGRAIYTLSLNVMKTISGKKAGSLKWIILIMVYNILVNPLGRKLIFKQPRLRENLESCLLPSNCVDIIGAALHIIKIFIDDFIDDNEMISVLIYQLPLKQIKLLSEISKDINIRKLALTIVSRIEKKMIDCYSCASCRKAVSAGPSLSTCKQINFNRKKLKKRRTTTSSMTDSICAECETDGTGYANRDGTEVKNLNDCMATVLFKPPERKQFSKKQSSYNKCGEICPTPSLKAKYTKKLTLKTLFKPNISKSMNLSCLQLQTHSTSELYKSSAFKQKSKSQEYILKQQNKLMDINKKTVIDMLSKLDLDTYLRSSYDGLGIPFKKSDIQNCTKTKEMEKKEINQTNDLKTCACTKTREQNKCAQLICVCAEIFGRQKVIHKPACLCFNTATNKQLAALKETKVTRISEIQKPSKSTGQQQQDCNCSKSVKGSLTFQEKQNTKKTCVCATKTEDSDKCSKLVCVCAEIAARQTKVQKGPWLPRIKGENIISEEGTKCNTENVNAVNDKRKRYQEVCVSTKITAVQPKSNNEAKSGNIQKEIHNKKSLDASNLNNNQEICTCKGEKVEVEKCLKQSKTPNSTENQKTCFCSQNVSQDMKLIPATNSKRCKQQICVCAEISTRQAKMKKGPWSPRTKSEINTNDEGITTSNSSKNQKTCFCSQNVNQLIPATNKKCCKQHICVCAEIFTRQAKMKKGPWSPRIKCETNINDKVITGHLKRDDQVGEPKSTAFKSNAVHIQSISIKNLKSLNTLPFGIISMQSKVIIRKINTLKPKRKVIYSKVTECTNKYKEENCNSFQKSQAAASKDKRTSCKDDCKLCMITLPKVNISNLKTEVKNEENRVVTANQDIFTCDCNH